MAENAGTGEYVQAPESVQPVVPVEDQLSQLKIAAKGKINEFVDKSNVHYDQAANDPANPASDERLRQDADRTTQDAANSYNKALNQLGDAFHAVEATGKQAAHQLGVATDETAANAQEATGAAREQAQQRSEEAKAQMHGGKSALQQGIDKVHDAMSEGAAVANQKLQEGTHATTTDPTTTVTESRGFHGSDPQAPSLFQSLGNVISQTAQSVKGAFITPSPTANTSHATPTSTNLPVTHPPAQTMSESIGQTAAALRDAVKSTWSSSPREFPQTGVESANPAMAQPGVENVNQALPADVPRRATE